MMDLPNGPWYQNPGWWEAFGTIAAVVVAVLARPLVNLYRWMRRPVLTVRFENRDPWRRPARILETRQLWVYFRVSVENTGASIARGVRGWAHDFRDRHNTSREYFDPLKLHWAGTKFEPAEMDLLPGQREFLDVMMVPAELTETDQEGSPSRRVDASEVAFRLIPQVDIPRGLDLFCPLEGQSVILRIAAENADLVELQFRVPDRPTGDTRELEVSCYRRHVHRVSLLRQLWRRHVEEVGLSQPEE